MCAEVREVGADGIRDALVETICNSVVGGAAPDEPEYPQGKDGGPHELVGVLGKVYISLLRPLSITYNIGSLLAPGRRPPRRRGIGFQ